MDERKDKQESYVKWVVRPFSSTPSLPIVLHLPGSFIYFNCLAPEKAELCNTD